MTELNFEQLVFSGGGTRCFWHGGFLKTVRRPLALEPTRIAGVSGGALAASCFIAGRDETLLETMGATFDRREENLSTSWNEVQSDGLTPHQRLYREIVTETLDRQAIAAIADGPSFQVLLAHPPTRLLPKWSTFPMMAAYLLDIAVRSTPKVVLPTSLGADQSFVDARQAARDGTLIDLICIAAVIPPVFNVEGWNGRPVIDGGMTSKAPMPDPNEGRTLILLTRRFRHLPQSDTCLYVQPSEAVPADKIDFTDRGKIEETWRQGASDGKAFLLRHRLGTDAPSAAHDKTQGTRDARAL